jgi:uncharacterized repeat protein (TIGR03803 family)
LLYLSIKTQTQDEKIYLIILLLTLIGFSNTANAQYTKLLDFGGTNGSAPYGSLIYNGTFLYGMTQSGGSYSNGTIFKIKPDGTGYVKLLDFDGSTSGSNPRGDLISDGTFLYGMTSAGGTIGGDYGTIFKIKSDGTGYATLLDFNYTNGMYPQGSLISDGSFLYGMTNAGGLNGFGTIFKIKPDGTGYATLLDFNGTNGSYPQGSLISDGTFLYGMTLGGGTNGYGTIFKIKTDGSGYVKILDFNGTNGRSPSGDLISDGSFLYGMTQSGGTYGNIFKIKPDGTGYVKTLDFNGTTNGSSPLGSLMSDGSFLYGMTLQGGTNGLGTIFKYALSAVGIAGIESLNSFVIYPNPNKGDFTIEGTVANKELVITNVLGELIFKTEISLSNMPAGIYFLQINTENGIISKKIFIQD